jgi:hypothetical protein
MTPSAMRLSYGLTGSLSWVEFGLTELKFAWLELAELSLSELN